MTILKQTLGELYTITNTMTNKILTLTEDELIYLRHTLEWRVKDEEQIIDQDFINPALQSLSLKVQQL